MTPIKRNKNPAGDFKKSVVRIDLDDWKRLDAIRAKYKFKVAEHFRNFVRYGIVIFFVFRIGDSQKCTYQILRKCSATLRRLRGSSTTQSRNGHCRNT